MVFAARLAEAGGSRPEGLVGSARPAAGVAGADPAGPLPPAVQTSSTAFRMDKKFHGGVRFVLLEDVGRPTVVTASPRTRSADVLDEMGAPV